MKPKVLAIVPARAGSKRLPQKNIKILDGIPLVAHTFEAIKKSQYINATIATSDCPEVLKISTNYANTYQLKRSAELASDTASTIDVLIDAVNFAVSIDDFDVICLLQPTSPLRTAKDIDNAISLYIQRRAKGVVSMTKCHHSPLWATSLESPNKFKKFMRGLTNTRSQDLNDYYQLNGAIYLIDKFLFSKTKKLFLENDFYPYVMKQENSIDIDSFLDFKLAELIIQDSEDKSN